MSGMEQKRAKFNRKFNQQSGCIYKPRPNAGWYWKVKLPGQEKFSFMPLVSRGEKFATKSRTMAEAIRRRMVDEILGQAPPSILDVLAKFSAVVAAESSAKNAEQYAWVVRQFCKVSKIEKPYDATPAQVQDYLAGMIEAKAAPGTARRHRIALLRFFGWCESRGMIEGNPVSKAKAPKVYHAPPRYLRDEEVVELRKRLTDGPEWLRKAVLLGLGTGMRLGEIMAVRWEDVRPGGQGHVITVGAEQATKGNVSRTLAWPMELAVDNTAGAIFPELPKWEWVNALRRVTAGLGAFGKLAGRRVGNQWHLLRSTHAVNRARSGATVWQLMAELGHTCPQTTMRYVSIVRAAGRD